VFTRLISSTLLAGLLLTAVPLLARGQAPADKAIIVVKVPEDAKLTIQGDATKSTGPERRFITPPLREGVTYSYNLVATWKADGKDQKAEKKVVFKTGQTVAVTLDKATPAVKDKDKDGVVKDKDKKNKKEDQYQAAMKKADAAMKAKKYADAIKAYGEALQAKPKDKAATDGDAEAAKLLANQTLEEKKKEDEAKKKKKEADDKKKKDADDKKKADDEKKKKDDEARKKKDDEDKKKASAEKKNADYLKAILEGSKAAEGGKFADAIKAYDAALTAKPGDKDATELKALAVKALDAEKKAADAKKKADEAKRKKDEDDKKEQASLLPPPTVERKE